MSDKKIHIVSFDNPYPPNYGGVIDVFYKIKAFYEAGFKVILHSFIYGRKPDKELEKYCETVFYYERKKQFKHLFSKLPFIIKSRQDNLLLENLLKTNAPILFEGLHTCFYLNHPKLKDRNKFVRIHNVEWKYYKALSDNEINIFKKWFFALESKKLKAFESKLSAAKHLFTLSELEKDYYKAQFLAVSFVAPFHPFSFIEEQLESKIKFALYHGNLSVSENEKAALFLIEKVYENDKLIPLKIAGRNPSDKLKKAIATKGNKVELIENPIDEKLQHLIKTAQINLLPTFQNTGTKLKLINALYNGKHCLVNDKMLTINNLDKVVTVSNSVLEWQQKILEMQHSKFSEELIEERKVFLTENIHNSKSISLLGKIK